jgi:hypothetical protein
MKKVDYKLRGVKLEEPEPWPGANRVKGAWEEKPKNQYPLIQTGLGVYPDAPKIWVPADKTTYQFQVEILKRQLKCSHRKGEIWQAATPNTAGCEKKPRVIFPLPPFRFDFNVGMHTFPDHHQEIWCMTCKRRWKSGDPDFDAAMEMVRNSSNKPSASEGMIAMPREWAQRLSEKTTVVFQDKL